MDLDLDLAPGWRPQDGDTIVGQVVGVDRMRSSQGAQEYYPVVTIAPEGKVRVEEGGKLESVPAIAVHAFHAVLKDRLLTQRPQIGERIGIKLVGTKRSQDGKRDVTVYVVKVDRSGGDAWANLGVTAPAAATSAPASDVPDDDIPF
jgi:hypothetical protein